VCDANPVRLRIAAERLESRPQVFADGFDLIENADLDAVIVTTPDCYHADLAAHALRRGVHALIDKPLATTTAGARAVLEAAHETRSIAMVGFNLRHTAVMRKLKDLVTSGELGRVHLVENREFYSGGRTYMARWNRSSEWSGGLWLHKGSHDFDVFNWLLGFPRPLKVSSFAGINVFNRAGLPFDVDPEVEPGPTCSQCAYAEACPDACIYHEEEWSAEAVAADGYARDLCMYLSDKDTHDNGFAMIEYENGARASHMECFFTGVTDRFYTVVGDRAQAHASIKDRRIEIHRRWPRRQAPEVIDLPFEQGGHDGADEHFLDSFLDALRSDTPVPSTLEHGLWATAVGEAAERARREDRVVFIRELVP
jgi:predicted dehydrogenase